MYTTGTTLFGTQIHAVGYAGAFEDPKNPSRKALCGTMTYARQTGNSPYVTCQQCKKVMFSRDRTWIYVGTTEEIKVLVQKHKQTPTTFHYSVTTTRQEIN